MDNKNLKTKELIRELAADYFQRESNKQSLITITDVELASRGGRATILVTVLPESAEVAALAFMQRQLQEFRAFVMEKARLMRVPYFSVQLDKGEKNRQRLDVIAKTM